tara:strand:- start:1293 stop:1487 length:195 start_codon:yes stop_codon:yes gene_type:complete
MNIPITKKQFRLLQDILERVNDCLLYDKDMKSFVEDDFVLTLSVSDKANLTKALSNFYDRKEAV